MGASGKKAKAKDKNGNGKAGAKQKNKSTKAPEATVNQTITEFLTPENPVPVVQEPELGQPPEPALEQIPEAIEPLESCSVPADHEECGDVPSQLEDPSNQPPAVKEDPPETAAPVLTDKDTLEAPIEPEESQQPIEDSHRSVEESPKTESRERTPVASPFVSHSPVPSQVPLPSPSLTEARFMYSASPESRFHPASPAAIPYASPVPYASPIAYASPVPYTPPLAYTSPYASPFASPFASPYVSPVPKVSSPLARSHYPYMPPAMPPTISPTATPPPPQAPPPPAMAPPPPPSTTQSYTTAVHSPVMSSAGVVPPYAPYPPPQPSPHYMHRSYSVSDQPYAASFQALRDLPLGNDSQHENGTVSPPENDAEHIELLKRIQSALPDINRLLHGFQNTHSRLNSREAEMKQIGNQHEQALMHKEFYIEALQSQMKKTANESAEECAKLKNTVNELRLELGNLQEKQRDLEDGLATHQKTNEELSQSKSDLEADVAKLNTSIEESKATHEKERDEQKEEHAKALATQKQELTELFEEIKNEDEKAAAEALEAREKELREQHEASKGEWEKEKTLIQETLETNRNELETTKAELASKIATLESKETELESRLAEINSVREEVASKLAELELKEKELQETREKNTQQIESIQNTHAGELDYVRQKHTEELAAAAKELNDKTSAIVALLTEKEKGWEAEKAGLVQQISEKDGELMSSEREKERLEGDGLVKEQQLQRAVDEMKSTIDHLDGDCDRLRKTLHSLGEATDLKTKGDRFL